jgi:hypothetical protein
VGKIGAMRLLEDSIATARMTVFLNQGWMLRRRNARRTIAV